MNKHTDKYNKYKNKYINLKNLIGGSKINLSDRSKYRAKSFKFIK